MQDSIEVPAAGEDEDLQTETAPAPESRRIPRARIAVALALAVFAVGFIQLYPTFPTAYAYDDMDCLNLAADVLAGKMGYWEATFRPHNEHFLPVMRVAFHASAARFGIDPVPFRLAIFAAHLATAWLLGMLALRYSGSAAAAMAAGLAYVLPGGFSSMMLWAITAAGVPIGLVGISGALLALAHRDTLGVRRARLLAGGGCLFALLSGSGLMPLLAGPLLLDELERRRAGARRWSLGPFAVFCLATMAATALATAFLYARVHGHTPALHVLDGIPRAAFLLLISPYRYVLPGLGLPLAGSPLANLILWSSLGLAVAAPVAALLLALWRRGASRLAQVAAVTAVGPVGVMLLVGAGRWNWTYVNLYEADRYFFVLFLPLAVVAGAVAAAVAERMRGWTARQRAAVVALCLVAAGAELVLHRRALLQRVPFGPFAAHERRFTLLSDLAGRLETAASRLPPGSPPLSFPDGSLWFRDVHNGRVSARMLLRVLGSGEPRLRLAPEPVSERDTRILNEVFAEWARAAGDPASAPVVISGRLLNAQAADIVDFRTDGQDKAVLSGFYPWEGAYRWMGRRGELRLTLAAPALQLLLAAPISSLRAKSGWDAILVSVTAVDETTRAAVPLGTVRVSEDGPSFHSVDPAPFLARFPGGKAILVLEADRTWRPSEVLAGSQDQRELSILVVTAGSAPP